LLLPLLFFLVIPEGNLLLGTAVPMISIWILSSFFTGSSGVIDLLESAMHTKLPIAPAFILVLAPSAVCLLWGVLYNAYFKRRNPNHRGDSSPRAHPPSQRPDDFPAILLLLGVATLAFAASASA
jgi:hypothetical protein